LKRTLTYFAVAVFLGITLTLIPLIVLAEIKPPENHVMSISILRKMRELESYSSLKNQGNASDEVTVLAVSFIIACIGYMILKRKTTRHEPRWGELY